MITKVSAVPAGLWCC